MFEQEELKQQPDHIHTHPWKDAPHFRKGKQIKLLNLITMCSYLQKEVGIAPTTNPPGTFRL